MARRASYRLADILEALDNIDALLTGATRESLDRDVVMRAAFERFLEIASEAARHLPPELTARHPEVPWRRVAYLGNVLRHAYHRTDTRTLWDIYEHDLAGLRRAVLDMAAARRDEADDRG